MNGNVEAMEIKTELTSIEERRHERKGVIYQILMGICANVVVVGPAMGFGYSAVALGAMKAPTSDVKINDYQANWIATASALGTPLGCLLSSVAMRKGRKICLLFISITSMIGWVTIYMASNYEQILTGRVISGIATGLASVPATVYTAEISGAKWRGTMVTWTSVAIAIGVLTVYIFGYAFKDDWRTVALMCSLFPLISIGLILTILPESPIWLRDRGRFDESLSILKKFRGLGKDEAPTADILLELRPRTQRKKRNMMKHMLRRNALIPFAIMLTYFLFQQFSGIFVAVYYAVDIIKSAGITIDPYLGAILLGLTRLVGSLLVAMVSKRFGRRIPSIVSGSGMTFFMGSLSLYLFMADRHYAMKDGGIIPVICVLMFIFLSTLGFLSIPFAMVGEIYPAKVKDILSGLTTCIAYVFSSLTVKTYPDMLRVMGSHGVFLFYTVVALVGTIFVALYLPETKGKTLYEIEDIYAKKKMMEEGLPENSIGLKKTAPSNSSLHYAESA